MQSRRQQKIKQVFTFAQCEPLALTKDHTSVMINAANRNTTIKRRFRIDGPYDHRVTFLWARRSRWKRAALAARIATWLRDEEAKTSKANVAGKGLTELPDT